MTKKHSDFVQESINRELKKATVNENRLLNFLNSKTSRTFKKTNKYDCFDLKSKNKDSTIYIELKTRFIRKDQYPTTIIGTNKIEHAQKKCKQQHRRFLYVFEYDGEYYYIEHNPKLFNGFPTKIITRRDRQVSKLHTEIPVRLLHPICDLEL